MVRGGWSTSGSGGHVCLYKRSFIHRDYRDRLVLVVSWLVVELAVMEHAIVRPCTTANGITFTLARYAATTLALNGISFLKRNMSILLGF